MSAAYPPLLVRPRYESRPWGGRRLERDLGRTDLPPGPVGESWEVGDLPGWCSVVDGGPHDGRALRDVLRRPFPLLLKVLDAREDLSVQVHPDGADGGEVKEEAWVALADGGQVALASGPFEDPQPRGAAWLSRLARVPLRAGGAVDPPTLVHVPPGTVHAVLAGTLLFEVQNPADVTWRLYDHGRRDAQGRERELHVEQAAALLRRRPAAAAVAADGGRRLGARRFGILLLPPGEATVAGAQAAFFCQAGRLQPAGGLPFAVPAGRTVVLPPGRHALECAGWILAVGAPGDSLRQGA